MLNARLSTLRQAGTASRRTRDLRLKDPSPLMAKRTFQLLLSALVSPRRSWFRMSRNTAAARHTADTLSLTTLPLRRTIAQLTSRSMWRENQLDRCTQLTEKRMKNGATDAF